jgi:hypothetical protein
MDQQQVAFDGPYSVLVLVNGALNLVLEGRDEAQQTRPVLF